MMEAKQLSLINPVVFSWQFFLSIFETAFSERPFSPLRKYIPTYQLFDFEMPLVAAGSQMHWGAFLGRSVKKLLFSYSNDNEKLDEHGNVLQKFLLQFKNQLLHYFSLVASTIH